MKTEEIALIAAYTFLLCFMFQRVYRWALRKAHAALDRFERWAARMASPRTIFALTIRYNNGDLQTSYWTDRNKVRARFDAMNPGDPGGDGRMIMGVHVREYWNHDTTPPLDLVLDQISQTK
jgi:hypothetical protein